MSSSGVRGGSQVIVISNKVDILVRLRELTRPGTRNESLYR